MNKQLQRQLKQWEQEADREREAAGLMSKRKLAAILHSSPDLQRAIMGAAAPQKGGTHDNTGKAAPAQHTAAEATKGGKP